MVIKESEKLDINLGYARKRKNLFNMKVTVIPIVVGIFGTISMNLEKGLWELEIEIKTTIKKSTKQKWKEKQLYGYFKR